MAVILGYAELITKFSSGDMVAQNAHYHRDCLIAFYWKINKSEEPGDVDDSGKKQGMAIADVLSYINNVRSESYQAPVFKLINLVDMYKERLEFYGLIAQSQAK